MQHFCSWSAITILVTILGGNDGIASGIFVEHRSVTSGTFRTIEIGATKEATLGQIYGLGVFAVTPIPPVNFNITRANRAELGHIRDVEGIRLTNHGGIAIDLFFKNGAVDAISRSVPAAELTWFHEGEPIGDVIEELSMLLDSDNNLVVFAIARHEGDQWVELSKGPAASLDLLRRHDAWSFEVQDKPGGAIFDLYFQNDRLTRIDYRRPRIRLD
jgi:hypothetical protein